MILACHNLNKAFGEHTIVCDGSFHIEDREKAALVGINGAGKSTILKMIIGEEPLDGGDVILAKGKTLGYLAQRQDLTSGNTIYEEVKSVKADIFAMEAQPELLGLTFTPWACFFSTSCFQTSRTARSRFCLFLSKVRTKVHLVSSALRFPFLVQSLTTLKRATCSPCLMIGT